MTSRSIALALLLAGCSTKSASLYKTSQMQADMSATGDEFGSTTVIVNLHDTNDPLVFLQLTSDDKLTATMAGDLRTLAETSLLGAVGYSATFNSEADGADILVVLSRKIDSGAPDSYVDLPATFTIGQMAQTSYSRASDAIAVNWTSATSADAMTLDLAATCLLPYHLDLGTAATTATIPAGALKKAPSSAGNTVPDECDGIITLARNNQGKIDPAFAGGSFTGSQSRTVSFHTKP